jgi:hypothetical protein
MSKFPNKQKITKRRIRTERSPYVMNGGSPTPPFEVRDLPSTFILHEAYTYVKMPSLLRVGGWGAAILLTRSLVVSS